MSIRQGNRKEKNYYDTKIYKITNLVNNKVYVGQTNQTLQRRFNAHCWKNSGCIKLKNAINKYGKNNFIIEQIDNANTREEANKKEIFWINRYKSTYDKFGYNILNGGNDVFKTRKHPVMCLETKIIYKSIVEASKKTSCNDSLISNVCCGRKNTAGGYHWAYIDKNNQPILSKINLNSKPKKIKIKCIETNKLYNSISEAANDINCSWHNIKSVLKSGRKTRTAKGFHWIYVDQNLIPKECPKNTNKSKVKVRCIDNNMIFDSINKCAEYFNTYRSNIYNSINNHHKCHGMRFEIVKEVKACP